MTSRRTGTKTNSECIKVKNENMLFEQKNIGERWVEYIPGLYDDGSKGEKPIFEGTMGRYFLSVKWRMQGEKWKTQRLQELME